ncbi:ion transporter [Pontiella agarivorans]|uniref:Ion transporter n=1 Tax=Pontiella agarivorans TaxID=3038953 RepID=A0ABU5N1H5_9BACT|nr:ion transporter [Pontiella agarivorans]MDZ8120273.1 ion transporter [Pontiella agarivorans]
MRNQPLKEKLFIIIFGADTPAGKAFDVGLFAAILISVGLTMLNSVHSVRDAHGLLVSSLNTVFTVLFTIEYVLRLYCAKNPVKYAHSFFGVVDLLAVLPFYLGLFIDNAEFLDVIKVLRMLRIFRVLKMAQYVGEADLLLNALMASRRKIGIFLVTVLTLVIIVGSLMYAIEGEQHGFNSIPQSVYWAIITVTTVGYGDMAPQTPLGQTLAAFLMIIAYSIIAVPTGIITAEVGLSTAMKRRGKICPSCKRGPHDTDAKYCKFCGAALD